MAPRFGRKATAAPSGPSGNTGNGAAAASAPRPRVAKADWKDSFAKKQVGASDMTLLTTISNEAINENLKKRFEAQEIYTYIGHVLISVNPFQMLPIYTDEILRSYRGKNRLEMAPHVYSIAEGAYYNMTSYFENQCVIISGESGAGKTEAAKRIMQYIAAVSSSSAGNNVKDMVLATNPLLESFGCAKTLRNNNSSRHGKYLEIEFDRSARPAGAVITNYLLEKNRVTNQIRNERNFHIFYQFTKAASREQRETYGVQTPESYTYIAKAGALDVPGISDEADWKETLRAMDVIGITPQEKDDILRVLATILWIGNCDFVEDQNGNAQVADMSVPDFVGYLLGGVPGAQVARAFTIKVVETNVGIGRRGSMYESPLNIAQATAVRDALAKALYNNLFEWIVDRVNMSMRSNVDSPQIISVLDIYGFEIFDTNQFEQLCINYVNEKLQQIFIELTLRQEQEEYRNEQIQWNPIKFFDNKIVCELIENKVPVGLFATLNDAVATAHADPSAADNAFSGRMQSIKNPQFDARGSKFLIKHYAGDVMYTVSGMTEKNKDVMARDLWDLVAASPSPFIQTLFPNRPDPNSRKRPTTASDKIKTSANLLVEKLMRSRPSYIRTIKPNENKSPREFDSSAVLHQVKYLGLQENIRVRRAGFAYRTTFDKFLERFCLLSRSTSYAGNYTWQGDLKSGCARLLQDTNIASSEWQLGITKVFIKNPETIFALEAMRDRFWHTVASRIQRYWRAYFRHKQECARKIQRWWRAITGGDPTVSPALRDYGHQVLAGRKERRRFSLLASRRFFGDYLGLNDKSPQGDLLRSAAQIPSSDHVVYSSRCRILVSRLARSSILSPRFVIVTNSYVYILITQLVDGRPMTTLERQFRVSSIDHTSLSNLRDDWIGFNLKPPEEPDVIIHTHFKTELVTHLAKIARIPVSIGSNMNYLKKRGKPVQLTFIKDPSLTRDDIYKSKVVHVAPGEPPSSVSYDPPRRKGFAPKPKPAAAPRQPARPAQTAQQNVSAGVPAPKGAPIATVSTNDARRKAAPPAPVRRTQASTVQQTAQPAAASVRAPPPRAAPPPPRPPPQPGLFSEPGIERAKALYAFATQESYEMALDVGQIVEVEHKDQGGWWLVKKDGQQGWAPSNYLEVLPLAP